ncbi:MAG: AAA family ATPase [Myxococcales bacterium]|nr:AAA family ATPase [Myxococcales bacterium]
MGPRPTRGRLNTTHADGIQRLIANVESVFRGKPHVVQLATTALLAGGHLLVEDVPGVGKTLLARAFAASLGLSFSRIQFTSDLLPADIIGVNVFDQQASRFVFKPGPIFANIVLADEINRTAPRTQSSLLEAMSERQVSIDDATHKLDSPFLVIATQNPLESHGTYPLPESQLDRFLMRISVGYPVRDVERAILVDRGADEPVELLRPVLTREDLLALQAQVDRVRFDDSLADYVMDLVEVTRRSVRLAIGVSTRGALALQRAARAAALVAGRDFVTPGDVKAMAVPVLSHRVSLGAGEQVVGGTRRASEALMRELVASVEAPV